MSFTALGAFIFSFALLCALTVGPADAATDPGVACAVAKQKAAAKMLSDEVKCHGTALKKGAAVDPACLMKAEAKFDASFVKAEAKGGCVTMSDAATIKPILYGTLDDLLFNIPPTTTTTTLPATCSLDDSYAACGAYKFGVDTLGGGTCFPCMEGCCDGACFDAYVADCQSALLNALCMQNVNELGCAEECCP
jgi:hypothetical protein